MLRIGFQSGLRRRLVAGGNSTLAATIVSTTTSSPSLHEPSYFPQTIRCLSSEVVDDPEDKRNRSHSLRRHGFVGNGKNKAGSNSERDDDDDDELAMFTERRKRDNAANFADRNTTNSNGPNRNHRHNNNNNNRNNSNYHGNRRNNNNNNNNNRPTNDGRNNSNRFRGNNNNNNNRRNGNNNQNNNKNASDQNQADSRRLTEILAQLRMSNAKNSPTGSTNNSITNNTNSSMQQPQNPLASVANWRQRFARSTNNTDSVLSAPQDSDSSSIPSLSSPPHPPLPRFESFLKSPNRSRSNNGPDNISTTTRTTPPGRHLFPRQSQQQQTNSHYNNRNNNNNNNKNNHMAPQRTEMEFLQGRLAREQQSEAQNTNRQPVEESTRIVTLPGNGAGLTLTETSFLFRIKRDVIRKKLVSMGLLSSAVVDSDNNTDDDDYDNDENAKGNSSDNDIMLDADLLELLAMEYGIETVRGEDDTVVDQEELLMQQRRADDMVAALPPRPPVVCIMGHVDHGKTTLMDALRRRSLEQQNPKLKKSKGKKNKNAAAESATKNVAGTEAGGITQIISAFQVDMEGQDNKVTFLDTPGHAAFKSMRQSGSHAADVIVLVIAADDGVSEQTIEILNFYKSIVKGSQGGISMVVALNKIDKPGIDVDEAKIRIENQLLEQGIICEGMGGDSEFGPPVQVIPTSGLTGLGLDELMEGLVLQSEVMDLRADPDAHAEGIVMDARVEKGLGVVADCIIRWGSMEKGDILVCGTQSARIRMLKDVNDKMLKKGLPSQPVRIVGFKSIPKAGDPILCVETEDLAREMVEQRASAELDDDETDVVNNNDVELHINGMRSRDTARAAKIHEMAGLGGGDDTIRIPIIVKADADGSLSAVRESLVNLGEKSSHKVFIDPIQEGVGEITPTDIQMAKESEACIFAFGLKRISQATLNLADAEGVTIRSNDIIYSLLDDAKVTLGTYLPPQPAEHIHGRAVVQAIFTIDSQGGKEKIAGLRVTNGNIYKEKGPVGKTIIPSHFRVFRNGEQISPVGETVRANTLRKFKDLVDSVRHGDECGLGLSGFVEFEEGDEIECYSIEMKSGSL